MKFKKNPTQKGTLIPRSALKLAGMAEREELEMHTPKGAVILLRKQMTAAELVEAIDALGALASRLISHLVDVCGACEDCWEEDECPFGADSYPDLPDLLRQEAGISPDAKLVASVNEDNHTVTLVPAQFVHDLRDVSPSLLTALKESGVCLGELEEHLMREDVVYG